MPPARRQKCSFGGHSVGSCIRVRLEPEEVLTGSAGVDININININDRAWLQILVKVIKGTGKPSTNFDLINLIRRFDCSN